MVPLCFAHTIYLWGSYRGCHYGGRDIAVQFRLALQQLLFGLSYYVEGLSYYVEQAVLIA